MTTYSHTAAPQVPVFCADQCGNHIFTFGTLELENEKCFGIQCSSCHPFTLDKWFGTNKRQYVALIPPSNYSKIKFADFDITIKEHRDKIWFGSVELLFHYSFQVSDSDPEPPRLLRRKEKYCNVIWL